LGWKRNGGCENRKEREKIKTHFDGNSPYYSSSSMKMSGCGVEVYVKIMDNSPVEGVGDNECEDLDGDENQEERGLLLSLLYFGTLAYQDSFRHA
jgi:hypothetical protein